MAAPTAAALRPLLRPPLAARTVTFHPGLLAAHGFSTVPMETPGAAVLTPWLLPVVLALAALERLWRPPAACPGSDEADGFGGGSAAEGAGRRVAGEGAAVGDKAKEREGRGRIGRRAG